MKSLNDLQTRFFSELTAFAPATLALNRRENFSVYQHAYRIRIREAIEEDFAQSFAALRALTAVDADQLFDEFFATAYSPSYTLNAIGRTWLEFLRRRELPHWWMELSRFEWELILALYRDSNGDSRPHRLALGETAEAPQIQLAPALTVFNSSVPTHDLYENLSTDATVPWDQFRNAVSEKPEHTIAIWREKNESRFAGISKFSAKLIHLIQCRLSWPELTARLQDSHNEQELAALLESSFRELSALGVIL